MLSREDIFSYVKDEYGTKPDYTWDKFPNYAILRHDSNEKWYGLIMDVSTDKLDIENEEDGEVIDVLNVKCEKELVHGLIDHKEIVPAYHMDKENWISIVLKNVSSKEKVFEKIDDSFQLTTNYIG